MADYLIEVGYTSQSWSAQIDNRGSVVERITPVMQACGGTLRAAYYAFGDVDLVCIADFRTPEDAAAFALATSSSGALRLYRTTPLLSVDQGLEALRRATELRKVYTPPLAPTIGQQAAPVG